MIRGLRAAAAASGEGDPLEPVEPADRLEDARARLMDAELGDVVACPASRCW